MKQLVILLLISSSVLGQQHLSLNLGGAAALNFNHSSRALEQPFEIYTNYISPNILANLTLDVNRSFLSLESSYHFRSYGFVIDISETDYHIFFKQKQNTESFSVNFNANQFLYYSPKIKSQYFLVLGSGISFINHVSTEWRRRFGGRFGYYKIAYEGAFERNELSSISATASLGLSIKSILKNIGPIYYGLRYNYDFKPTPYLSFEFEHNGKQSEFNFQTQQHYVMAFLTVTLFDFEKQHDKWKWRRY